MGVFLQLFLHKWRKRKIVFRVLASDYVENSKFFLCVQYLLINLLFKLKRMKKNVKQKAGFRWKCVLKSMFIPLFTRINIEQSSIVSKISIYLATHVIIYFIR